MKNHFDYLKVKYTAWLTLRNKTGNIYDESTNTFNLSEDEWKIEIMKNKNVESLKTTTLPFPELCAPLFDGTLSTGIKSNGPSSTEPRRVVEPHVVEDDEDIEAVSIESPTPPCSSRPSASESPPKPPSIEDCESKLNGLGWDKSDPLYETALAIFCDLNDHYRECWMKLKPERFAPQLYESAGGLPKMKLVSHSCSLAGSTSAMEVLIPIAFVLPGREHECNESFKLGRPPALS
ncbi:hypothetical protein Tco_0578620 [Tanacetum coccineum]